MARAHCLLFCWVFNWAQPKRNMCRLHRLLHDREKEADLLSTYHWEFFNRLDHFITEMK
jgi:hypothetical protein